MINIKNMNFKYGQSPVLNNINLTIQPGEIVGIVGESGSGKTTLAQIILGLLPVSQEQYTNNDLRLLPIFQHAYDSFNPKFKMSKSLEEAIKYRRESNSYEIHQRMHILMKQMHLDKNLLNSFPDQLSGGQLQRFNTIRTLMLAPDMLICDEITASLDVIAEQSMIEVLKQYYADTHKGMLLISHDLAFLNNIVERLIVMKNGEIVDDFNIKFLFDKQRHAYTKQLLAIY
ncbi:ATP-binding cassette domain-containing protein [Staphylococcus pseudoxylosus]|uniref:ABC transporter ATP-binding protein n=1 Tax=Staphylococcus pseudoxylosus TaxID=2282419 RepID=UPI000D1FAB47|nr:ATP-binding cassette domain-containing protein [Staphylococcus pseudoxylosus]PTI58477.1 peptide ABC transporter ATP-binding protein [Staphylococcus xylosus]MDW8797739.1 ATP-binding cassette domain-containing protein [Staphylococcus pseudoxylosus]MEB6036981.1 ATP-binding cassette domain-containing protein [Staphylococcus pseudoxylosus]MEB7753777.1 ATP-binding cassette domain-containing protein [Staphylococcus pseudoxylosus]MEB7764532.1 ATP-binding cassette domain-containing protein [Staphylo